MTTSGPKTTAAWIEPKESDRKDLILSAWNRLRQWKHLEPASLASVLLVTALLYSWRLDQNGWANPYYSAAAQSGASDWTAWFYGSADAGKMVTIDKTPLSVWVMGLSVRLFGLNSWSLLLPQVLMGVVTTWLIYKIIRLHSGSPAALFGAVIYASTPVVVLMSRFNNPEPLMGLLVLTAVYCALKAVTDSRWRWYVSAGAALGFAFMAKQVQALFVVPALLATVLVHGAGPPGRRVTRLLGAAATLVVTGGWWIAAVEVVPSAARPYIGGSAGDSALELTTGYNGLARFAKFANQDGAAVPSEDQSVFDTFQAGITRLFSADFAQESAWFLFPALCCALVLLVLRGSSSQRVMTPTAVVATVWLLTAFGVLCFAGTMVHSYYTFSLAAPMSIVLVLGLKQLWDDRERPVTRLIGSVVVASAGYIGSRVVDYSDGWPPYWSPLVLGAGLVAAIAWVLLRNDPMVWTFVVIALLLGPISTNMITVNAPQTGTNPLSGPDSRLEGSLSQKFKAAAEGKDPRTLDIAFGSPPDPQLVEELKSVANGDRWAAVTVTAQNAALYQLESGKPVAALGGWLGLDPAPTLAHFKDLVARGEVGVYIDQPLLLTEQRVGRETAAIIGWIRENFVPSRVGNEIVYHLS